ncbi:MAG TPA: hypothetical protein VHD90_19025 [Phototrophicaceae bacterium]|nr:hypothetical protein [Phototrophicaceae bacterium]
MSSPQLTLQCTNARLELYADCVMIHPIGSFARIFGPAQEAIPIEQIEKVKLVPSNTGVNGILMIIYAGERRKTAFAVFSHQHTYEARAVFEALEDRIHPQDILPALRELDTHGTR